MVKLIVSVVIVYGGIVAWKLVAKDPKGAAKGVHHGLGSVTSATDTVVTFFSTLGATATLIVFAVAAFYFLLRK